MKRSGLNEYEKNKVYVRISTKINPNSRHRFKFQFHLIQIPDIENKAINTTNHGNRIPILTSNSKIDQ